MLAYGLTGKVRRSEWGTKGSRNMTYPGGVACGNVIFIFGFRSFENAVFDPVIAPHAVRERQV